MTPGPRDVAQIRFDNALLLFDEFVRATVKSPDAATLRGLEGRFAERLQIQPSYWSQIKSRSRQIGERLARQFELLCRKPIGWMDQAHAASSASGAAHASATSSASDARAARGDAKRPPLTAGGIDGSNKGNGGHGEKGNGERRDGERHDGDSDGSEHMLPRDADERFIVGLVLTYYRRHPERARTRLLDLLGEVLTPTSPAPIARPAASTAKALPPVDDGHALWNKTQAAVKPLKPKR